MEPPTTSSRIRTSNKAMPVSQSPDSVGAAPTHAGPSDNAPVVVTASTQGTPEDAQYGGIFVPTCPTQTQTSGASSPVVAARAAHPPPPARTRPAVKNPYVKEKPSPEAVVVDEATRRRREFADRYRREAILHSQRRREARASVGGGQGVSSTSALDVVRSHQRWRRSWRDRACAATNNQSLSEKERGIPLRPRLFLFSRNAQAGHQRQLQGNHPTTTQQPQTAGVWELGPGITELAGEGGSGKTQICLSLCVTCATTPLLLPGCHDANDAANYTAIYISMGEGIPSVTIARRMETMAQARLGRTDPDETRDVLSRIGLLSIRNEEEFVDFVEQDLPELLESHNRHWHQRGHGNHHPQPAKIGVVAFDGIAGFFRFSDPLFQHSRQSKFHIQRSARFLRASSELRRLSDAYDVPMVITNQVTASMSPDVGATSPDPLSFPLNPDKVEPALGLAWSNCVNTRYLLQRRDGMVTAVYDEVVSHSGNKRVKRERRVRKARVLQSVNMPKERELLFVIDGGGMVAVS